MKINKSVFSCFFFLPPPESSTSEEYTSEESTDVVLATELVSLLLSQFEASYSDLKLE